jgi:hypothetical protein
MRNPLRLAPLFLASVLSGGLATYAAGQTAKSEASPTPAQDTPGYAKALPIALGSTPAANSAASGRTLMFPPNAITSREIFLTSNSVAGGNAAGTNARNSAAGNNRNNSGGIPHRPGGNIPGLLTVPTFAGAFAAQGGPSAGRVFPYIMIGNDPVLGGTTEIPANITTVSLNLLDVPTVPAGLFASVPFSFEDVFTDSPNFEEADYTSGHHIQFGDAVQRAEFFNTMGEHWHTVLEPSVVNRVTIDIPRHVQVQLPDGSIVTVQSYYVGQAPDGTEFIELLDLLFNALYFNQAVNDINANNYTTDAFNMQAWPNTFLFSIDQFGNKAPGLVLGFHTYIFDPTVTPEPRWIFAFSSWISPGLFKGFQDVTALSHETSEALNDPFGNTAVPRWQFPGQPPTSKVCQGNLETGDPVEVLPNATVSINLRERNEVFLYHPQTEALLQWFEMGTTSDAISGAFSYPNTTALPQSAVPCPQ